MMADLYKMYPKKKKKKTKDFIAYNFIWTNALGEVERVAVIDIMPNLMALPQPREAESAGHRRRQLRGFAN
jgi:hypothetical protein